MKYATMVKDFGSDGLKAGEEVAVIDESSFAYKVKWPSESSDPNVVCFVPKDCITEPTEKTVEQEVDNTKVIVDTGISDAESDVLNSLLGSGLVIGSSTFEKIDNADSGVKDTGFVPPKSNEEIQEELKAKEKAEHKAKWDAIRKALAPHKKPKLPEGSFFLSDLTNGALPDSGVNHIIKSYPMEQWDKDSLKDIPDVNVFYHWDPNMLEAIHLANVLEEKILITGLPGTGKTTAIQQYAAHIRQPYMRFNGKDGIEQSSFLGYPWATAKGMEWKDGVLPQGMKLGYLVCIDEVFKIPAGIQMAMQGLYEKKGTLMLDDKPGEYHEKLVVPKDTFRLMLTDNVRGTGDDFEKFASTQIQDSSTLDRFGITYELEYLKADHEEDMLQRMFPKANSSDIGRLVKFAGLVRAGYKQGEIALTLSSRGLVAALEMVTKLSMPLSGALDLAFTNKIADDTELQAIDQMKSTVGGF